MLLEATASAGVIEFSQTQLPLSHRFPCLTKDLLRVAFSQAMAAVPPATGAAAATAVEVAVMGRHAVHAPHLRRFHRSGFPPETYTMVFMQIGDDEPSCRFRHCFFARRHRITGAAAMAAAAGATAGAGGAEAALQRAPLMSFTR